MLAAERRLHDAASFRDVTRRGRRLASGAVVVHVLVGDTGPSDPVRLVTVGLVVSKAVGNSVVRSRVKRRLRHQVRPLLDLLPDGTRVVVRALPAAGHASSGSLRRDLERCLGRVLDDRMQAPS